MRDQKGFSLVEILIVLCLSIAVGVVGLHIYRQQHPTISSETRFGHSKPDPIPPIQSVSEGEFDLSLKASGTIKLISGATISLASLDASSAPYFKYGQDESKIIDINSTLAIYHKGYTYEITKKDCKVEEKSFDDYSNNVVTACNLHIRTGKSAVPLIAAATVTKQLTFSEHAASQQILNQAPILVANPQSTRLTKPINGGGPYLEHGKFIIVFTTSYGVKSVAYTAKELYAKQSKTVDFGSAQVIVKPTELTCTPPYLEHGTCQVVLDKFIFEVTYELQQSKSDAEIVIINTS